MEFLLTALTASGWGAVAAAAATVAGLAAAAALARKAGIVGMGRKDRSNAPPGYDRFSHRISTKCSADRALCLLLLCFHFFF